MERGGLGPGTAGMRKERAVTAAGSGTGVVGLRLSAEIVFWVPDFAPSSVQPVQSGCILSLDPSCLHPRSPGAQPLSLVACAPGIIPSGP
jgi:hypothetical protein